MGRTTFASAEPWAGLSVRVMIGVTTGYLSSVGTCADRVDGAQYNRSSKRGRAALIVRVTRSAIC